MVPRVPKVLMMLMAMVVVMETMIVSAMLLMWDACQQSGADCWPNVQTCHLGILAILLIMLTRWHWWYWSWWLGWWWSWWWGWWWWCWYSRCYWWRGEASVWCWLEPQLGESRAWLGLEGGEGREISVENCKSQNNDFAKFRTTKNTSKLGFKWKKKHTTILTTKYM